MGDKLKGNKTKISSGVGSEVVLALGFRAGLGLELKSVFRVRVRGIGFGILQKRCIGTQPCSFVDYYLWLFFCHNGRVE